MKFKRFVLFEVVTRLAAPTSHLATPTIVLMFSHTHLHTYKICMYKIIFSCSLFEYIKKLASQHERQERETSSNFQNFRTSTRCHRTFDHTHLQLSHTHLQLGHTHLQLSHTHLQLSHSHLHIGHAHLQLGHTHYCAYI